MPRSTHSALCAAARWAGAAGTLALIACAGPGSTPAIPARDAASPVVRGAENGLEMWWWVVADDRGQVGTALAAFSDRAVPVSEDDSDRLAAGGLRLLSLPVADLDPLQARLPVIGSVQRQWLGEVPDWTDVLSGPVRESRTTVSLGDGMLELEPGRIRLLLRCWIAPAPAPAGQWPAAILRVELAPQHIPADRGAPRLDLAVGPRRQLRPESEGLVLGRLGASLAMRGGEALLLVPESPEVDWNAPPPDPQAEPDTSAGTPPPPPLLTVGEAMLAAAPDPATRRRVRAIVVLIPRVPERFELTRR